jgi:hypothetical protein
LPAKPKSISQTSPRRGVDIFIVEASKKSVGSGTDLFVRERSGIERQRTAQNLVGKDAFLFGGQVFESL